MKVLVVLLLIIGGVGAFLYLPRGGASTSATNAATIAILNTTIEGSRAGSAFAPALDGEVYASGGLVRANLDGRGILTFFDASTLSVDPGSQVKVLALNRLPGDGIQVTIEQTLGRSWSSVQKLKTPDSKYEIRTPSTTSVVRGTAFLTLVQQLPTGGTQTTYQVDDGTLIVTANAGGTVAVPAGTQVMVAEGAPAPANPTPIPPSPRLEITGSAGLGFLAVAPTGAVCGPAGGKAEIFGCVASGTKVTVRDPAAGRWGLFLTSGASLGATITVEGFVGTSRSALRAISRTLNANDLVRSGITVTGGTTLVLSQFEELTLVSSVCAATATGRIFAGGTPDSRLDTLRTFAKENRGTAVSVIYTEAELNQSIVANAPTTQGVTLNDAKITIDGGGIHGTAKAAAQFITVNASADVIGGPVGDKFTLRVSRLSADPLPPGLLDAVRGLADTSTGAISSTIPFLVKQVSFRNGCFSVSGVTPP
jgi:hypothetical protein